MIPISYGLSGGVLVHTVCVYVELISGQRTGTETSSSFIILLGAFFSRGRGTVLLVDHLLFLLFSFFFFFFSLGGGSEVSYL